uniref:EF-hand domain-containing protein n=1 Tax=Heterorhabditis bacteriophora TaxID=37862 RepID=A0A1I7WFT4_HETBA
MIYYSECKNFKFQRKYTETLLRTPTVQVEEKLNATPEEQEVNLELIIYIYIYLSMILTYILKIYKYNDDISILIKIFDRKGKGKVGKTNFSRILTEQIEFNSDIQDEQRTVLFGFYLLYSCGHFYFMVFLLDEYCIYLKQESVSVAELRTTTKSSSFAGENLMHKEDESPVSVNKVEEIVTSPIEVQRKMNGSTSHSNLEAR